ncbi:MAG: amino acid decarboxylase [Anaerotignum sp.]|nr:amino acid decarboxylase [Anaerotignum sp.]
MNTPICDFINKYVKKDTARLHMPGHKGVSFLGCEKMDITEIRGADELYDAEGIIAESEANASELFGFGKTIYGTEGSSQCIRAMLFLALQGAEKKGERPLVLAARNAHKAFLYSCALMDLDVEWILPEEGERSSLCTCPITAEQIERKLAEMEQKPFAVYITAPDYLGYSPDIRALAEVCKKADIPLLVDNAHGAYLKFLEESLHPIDLGAAMSCDSAHKTLPVLTGGAYLHLSEEWAEKIGHQAKKAMEIFGSTSPSYLILQSLDKCNQYIAEGYPEKLAETIEKAAAVKTFLQKQGWEVMDGDPLKLTIFTGSMGYTGEEAAEILRKNGVECEFADLDAVVLMATPENRDRDFEKVLAALNSLPRKEKINGTQMPLILPKQKMNIREAMFSQWEAVNCEDAVGRICASPCVSCPPAIPIAASGEEITAEMTEMSRAYGIEKIEVVRCI